MSLFTKTGAEASQSAMQDKSKGFTKFPPGTTFKVRVGSLNDVVEYFNHGDKTSGMKSSACAKHLDQPDLYDAAVDILYEESNAAKEAGDDKLAEELNKQAYRLKAKQRYIRGFFNLADSKPLVIDLTKNQEKAVGAALNKYAKKIDKLAFELSKTGESTSTVVSLTPVLDMDEDLQENERKNFAALEGKAFDHDLFEVLSLRDEQGQIADLIAFGFDVSKIGVNISVGGGATDGESKSDDDPTKGF